MSIIRTSSFFSCAAFLLAISSALYGFADGRFQHTTDKGAYGEDVTSYIMKSKGYVALPAKYRGNNGIDHIFVKGYNSNNIDEVIIVETKTDTSIYDKNQMSDDMIMDQIKRMKDSSDYHVRETARLLERNWSKVSKILVRHNTNKGLTEVSDLNSEGNVAGDSKVYVTKSIQTIVMNKGYKNGPTRIRRNDKDELERKEVGRRYERQRIDELRIPKVAH